MMTQRGGWEVGRKAQDERDICIYMADSLCCDSLCCNTTLQSNYMPIINFKKTPPVFMFKKKKKEES